MAEHMPTTSSGVSNNLSLPPLQSLKQILLDWGVADIIEGGIEGLSPDLQARIVPRFSNDDEFTQRVALHTYDRYYRASQYYIAFLTSHI